MRENILDEFQSNIMERLGNIYNNNNEYKKSLAKEIKLFNQLQNNFNREQMNMVEDYQKAMCATMGICELLAYRQGMRDLASILGVNLNG